MDRALRLRQQPLARRFSDNNSSVGIRAYDRRAKGVPVWPRDTLRLARLRINVRNEAIRRAKINSDYASHFLVYASASSFATLTTRLRMYARRFKWSFKRVMIFFLAASSASESMTASQSFAVACIC